MYSAERRAPDMEVRQHRSKCPIFRTQSQQMRRERQRADRLAKSAMEIHTSERLNSRRSRRLKSGVSDTLDECDNNSDISSLPPIIPAWEQFSDHIKRVSSVGGGYSSENSAETKQFTENLLGEQGSAQLKKIVKDMKDAIQKRHTKEQLAQEQLRLHAESERAAEVADEEDSSEDEDDEKYQMRTRKLEAQRHWGIIRRDVQERIRIRKEKNPAGGTWNNLRAQLRAMTRGDNVRREIYERYGIVARAGEKTPEDSMKPRLTSDIKQIVSKFYTIQIKKLRVSFS